MITLIRATLLCCVAMLTLTGCAELRMLREENTQLRDQNSALDRRAQLAETNATNLAQARAEQERTYQEELQRRQDEVQALLSAGATREQDLARQLEGAVKRSDEAEGRIHELSTERDVAQAALAKSDEALAQVRQALAAEQSKVQDAEKQRTALQAEQKSAAERLAAAETGLQKAQADLKAARDQVAALEKQLSEAKTKLAAAGETATSTVAAAVPVPLPVGDGTSDGASEASARATALLEAIQPALDPLLKGANGRAEVREGMVVVTLPTASLFETGVVELNAKGRDLLKKLADTLAAQSLASVGIAGHTDDQPIDRLPFYNNTELSFRRAFAIVLFLGEEAGLASGLLHAEAWGEHRPADSNKTAQGRAANRRVELLIVPAAP